jgi:hypothetical protein
MPESPAPRIQPANAQAAGIAFQPIAYADPKEVPLGLEVTFTAPGKLAPLGMVTVTPGCLVVVFPPDVTKKILESVRVQQAALEPGNVRTPGLKN